jgi:hypothetical protein
MLTIISTHEETLSKSAKERLWEEFMRSGTTHSGTASTLPYLIRRCEREKVCYRLTAVPGEAYFLERTET